MNRSRRSRCADPRVHDAPIPAFTMLRNPHQERKRARSARSTSPLPVRWAWEQLPNPVALVPQCGRRLDVLSVVDTSSGDGFTMTIVSSLQGQTPLDLSVGLEWHAALTLSPHPRPPPIGSGPILRKGPDGSRVEFPEDPGGGDRKVIYEAGPLDGGPRVTIGLHDHNRLFLAATDIEGVEHRTPRRGRSRAGEPRSRWLHRRAAEGWQHTAPPYGQRRRTADVLVRANFGGPITAAHQYISNNCVRRCGMRVITAEWLVRGRARSDHRTRSDSWPGDAHGPSIVRRPTPRPGSGPSRRTPRQASGRGTRRGASWCCARPRRTRPGFERTRWCRGS
jgi:hypothetical protein